MALRDAVQGHNSSIAVDCVERYIDSEAALDDACGNSNFLVLCADQPRLKLKAWVNAVILSRRLPSIAMTGNWVGPVVIPYESPCYVCQARWYRSRLADPQSFIAQVLTNPTPPRAAFGPGVVAVAGFFAAAVLHYLTDTLDRRQTTNSFRINLSGDVESIEYVRYRDCPSCGTMANRLRPSASLLAPLAEKFPCSDVGAPTQ